MRRRCTPVGRWWRFAPSLTPLSPGVARLLARSPDLDPARIDDVHFGNGNGAGEENRNVGRMATLLAGLPTSVPGTTTNRLCGSGLDAVVNASRMLAIGEADLAIAGGVKSMSRAPWVVQKPERPYERGHQQMHSTTLGWRMVNPRHPQHWTVPLGEGAEILDEMYRIDREEQDAFALTSHQRAAAARAEGRFRTEVIEVDGAELAVDETIRPETTLELLGRLRPVFRTDGTVTAGNASPMNDGAAALLLATEEGVATAGCEPLARIVSRATSGVDPHLYGIGPVEAAHTALHRAGVTWEDLTAVELNKAFAAQALNGRHWDSLLEAHVIIEHWRIDYNLNRPHTAHGDLTPTEFATNWTTINQPQAA